MGLFNGDVLVGAAVFHGLSAPETAVGAFGLQRTEQQGLWELGRFVLVPEYNGANWGTWFLARAIKLLRKAHVVRAIISYADSTLHTGALYRAASFIYCGLTTKKSDFIRPDGRVQERGPTRGAAGTWTPRPQKHRYVRLYDRRLKLHWTPVAYSRAERRPSVGTHGGCTG